MPKEKIIYEAALMSVIAEVKQAGIKVEFESLEDVVFKQEREDELANEMSTCRDAGRLEQLRTELQTMLGIKNARTINNKQQRR